MRKTDRFNRKANMKTAFCIALLFIVYCFSSKAVQVQDGEHAYSFQSVKVLQHLLESDTPTQKPSPRLAMSNYAMICANPTLPQEFLPLCKENDSPMVFYRLAAVPMDVCEICAFAACTGC